MTIQLLVSGDDPTSLAAQVSVLNQMLNPTTGYPQGLKSLGEAGTLTGAALNVPPVAGPTTPAAEPVKAPRAPRGGKKNTGANVDNAADPQRPAEMNAAENYFNVYESDGTLRLGFPDPALAAKLIAGVAESLKSVDELDLFAERNEATLQRMTDKERAPADEAIQKAYAALGVDTTVDKGDGNDKKEVSEADAKVALKAVFDTDAAKATEILMAVGAKHWKEVKPESYGKVMTLCDEARGLAKPTNAALFD